jgi:Tol biopolymer transport system component
LCGPCNGGTGVAARTRTESSIYIGELAIGNKTFIPRRFALDDWYNVVTDWTKDSNAILFHSKRNGRWAIFKQNIEAKTPETLIAGSENYFFPRLSSEGALLYNSFRCQS